MSGSIKRPPTSNTRARPETSAELYEACLWLSDHTGFPARQAPKKPRADR